MGKKTAEDKVNLYLFSPLHQKEPFLLSSSSEKKFMTKLNHKTQVSQSLNWPKSSAKCGKMLIQLLKKDWKKLIKSTKKKLLNKKLHILNNTARSKRKRKRNMLKSNDFLLIVCSFFLTLVQVFFFFFDLKILISYFYSKMKDTLDLSFNSLIIKVKYFEKWI